MNTSNAKRHVIIYNGPGVGSESIFHLENFFKKEVFADFSYELINHEKIINQNWEKDCSLFLLPGGADVPYTKFLNGKGNEKIKNFVEKGGVFLGICAGGYYGGSYVDFAKNTNICVQGERELGFFPGTVEGPMHGFYDYFSKKGIRAVEVFWKNKSLFKKNMQMHLYYYGGGFFKDAFKYPNGELLAAKASELPNSLSNPSFLTLLRPRLSILR